MDRDLLVGAVGKVAAALEVATAIGAAGPVRNQRDDVGAYLRAPEPATFYRMHGALTGAYDITHLAVRNRVVVTNKTPTGLNRGFGGPQIYFPLERLDWLIECLQRIKAEVTPNDRVQAGGASPATTG